MKIIRALEDNESHLHSSLGLKRNFALLLYLVKISDALQDKHNNKVGSTMTVEFFQNEENRFPERGRVTPPNAMNLFFFLCMPLHLDPAPELRIDSKKVQMDKTRRKT